MGIGLHGRGGAGPGARAATASEGEPLWDLEPEMLIVADPDLDLAPDPGPGPDLEPEPELASFSALAEPTAAAPLVWTEEAAPDTPTDPRADVGGGTGRARSGCR